MWISQFRPNFPKQQDSNCSVKNFIKKIKNEQKLKEESDISKAQKKIFTFLFKPAGSNSATSTVAGTVVDGSPEDKALTRFKLR